MPKKNLICLIGLMGVLTSCVSQNPAAEVNRGVGTISSTAENISKTPSAADTPAPQATPTAAPTAAPTGTPSPTAVPAIDYASVRPYEVGQIMIVMYHGLVRTDAEEDTYQRSIAHFKRDLRTFYDKGFRLISMKDWANNHITTAPGYTPLVLTFDDGKSTAFSLENKNGQLQPVQDCAVDIMAKFSEQHPDFGNTAMFFVNENPFKGDGTLAERFKYLLDHGYEIGNHTADHKQMPRLDADGVQMEIGGIDQMIRDNAPGYEPYAFSYPYGERPVKALYNLVTNGTYNGKAYHYQIAVREGQSSSASALNRVGFDPINVPRVRASDNQQTDLGWTLKQYETHPELRYISDGNPDRIAVPREYEENVDTSGLNGKELFIY